MANYYTLFCNDVVIRKGKHNIEMVKALLEAGLEERKRLYAADDYDGLDAFGFDFDYSWDHDNKLTLQSEEHGNTDHAVAFLEDLVRRNLVKPPIAFYWAHTCSSLAPGDFNGGGALITKEKTYWYIPFVQIENKLARLKKEKR